MMVAAASASGVLLLGECGGGLEGRSEVKAKEHSLSLITVMDMYKISVA